MAISSLCGTVSCFSSQQPQSKCSLFVRITLFAVGILVLTISILALKGRLPLIGIQEASGLMGFAALTLFVSTCFKCVLKAKSTADGKKIFDSRIVNSRRPITETREAQGGGTVAIRIKITSLLDFLKSKSPEDTSLLAEVKQKTKAENLLERLDQNYETQDVKIALPIIRANNNREDTQLKKLLYIIFATDVQILNYSLNEISPDEIELINLLCFRIRFPLAKSPRGKDKIPEFPLGSLGWLLHLNGEKFTSTIEERTGCGIIPPHLFILLNRKQIPLLEAGGHFEAARIVTTTTILFPLQKSLTFMKMRAKEVFKELPSSTQKIFLPHMPSNFIFKQMRQERPLDYEVLTTYQIKKLLPTTALKKKKTKEKLQKIPTFILNQILHLLDGPQLLLIPDKHLKSRHLKLNALADARILEMFSPTSLHIKTTKESIDKLSLSNAEYVKKIIGITDFK